MYGRCLVARIIKFYNYWGFFLYTKKMYTSSHVLSKKYQKTVRFKDHP